jgi:hypothetical protein
MSGTCIHFIRGINPAENELQRSHRQPMSFHDSDIRRVYFGPLFFTRI